VIPFKGAWMEFATDINTVMYAYIDRKKKFPVTTLLRAIGFDTDKAILDIFDLADEVKATKELENAIGRKLAARVLRSWTEDFVDEDTGEVVTIERNEIILERDVVLDEDNIQLILEAETDTCHSPKRRYRRRLLHHIQYPAKRPFQLRNGSGSIYLPPAARYRSTR
jgi:DNA-directed RNA polymerase subunit beta